MTQPLTLQELKEIQQFYKDIHEDDKAREVEIEIDHRIDNAREEQASALEELNNFGGGPRW